MAVRASVRGHIKGCGTVFEVTPTGAEKLLYSFTNFPDGKHPLGNLIMDGQGNLYGITVHGGYYSRNCRDYGGRRHTSFTCGTVFEVTATGSEKVLYRFGGPPHDGLRPETLIMDAQGNLYGTTSLGGTNGAGIVFKLNSAGAETVLYNFCSQSGCADGRGPGSLVLDAQGNLYGATGGGGAYGDGTVFELTPDGTETVLYNFTEVGGSGPGTLIIDLQGGVYGITGRDGVYGNGTVFELTPDGTLTVLYNFTGGADGGAPQSLIMDAQGNFYGTTGSGGAHGYGTVFKLTP
jgi:uncharacterized repeat protein (TIGR03803 family)